MHYDVCAHIGGEGYLLDVQSDLLDLLNTRVVVPLMPAPRRWPRSVSTRA